MKLLLFRSLWTNGFDLDAALADCRAGDFDGVEGPLPNEAAARVRFARAMEEADVPWLAEIVTGGGYVPDPRRTPAEHLAELRAKLEAALAAYAPIHVTILAGSDAWPLAESAEFYGRALGICRELRVAASFETHRSRPTFSPWHTAELLRQFPELRLTCDFSHWCCVCERLVLDEAPELLALCAERARHIHARVGYAQGPQVPHPAAPEYAAELEAHERWWDQIWISREIDGAGLLTMAPEFGPDGYLQSAPFGGPAAASLDEVNSWMARRQRARYSEMPVARAA
jgi:hypothetical protein